MSDELFQLPPDSRAVFSEDRVYRYELWRRWGGGDVVVFIGLNPSTADESMNDPTIRRCIGFAKDWGYGGLCMLNLFAFRATDPAVMKAADDPVGPQNDETLMRIAGAFRTTGEHPLVIAAWGVHGEHDARARKVMEWLPNLSCLGLTKDGHPKHPLYLKRDVKPVLLGPLLEERGNHL